MADRHIPLTALFLTVCVFLTGNTPPTAEPFKPACTHKTPLVPGVLGSPNRLIQLPNREPGVSELAAKMRQVYDALKLDKEAILTGGQRPKLPSLSKLSCMWPTDMATRGPAFDALMVPVYQALERHEASPSKTTFNAVVDTCVSCHRSMCPGPVAALKGLYFQADGQAPKTRESESCQDK